ncbi:hypothetical protein PFISCL1PPCAC_1677, partial [Pristionchus fissidentatus]
VNMAGTQSDEVPTGFQCMEKKKCLMEYYYDASTCNTHEICVQPTESSDLHDCPTAMAMQVRVSPDDKWIQVENSI